MSSSSRLSWLSNRPAGYSTPSAYVAAFKLELGQTPRRFLQR